MRLGGHALAVQRTCCGCVFLKICLILSNLAAFLEKTASKNIFFHAANELIYVEDSGEWPECTGSGWY